MKSARRRVVVTGIGVISNVGIGRDAFAQALREGSCQVTPIQAFDTTGYPYAHATEVLNLAGRQAEYDELIKRMGRSAALAVLAAREAVQHAGLDRAQLAASGAGVVLGSTNGEAQVIDDIVRRSMLSGASSVPVERWAQVPAHRIPLAVAAELGLTGEAQVQASACAAGNYAIGNATDAIQEGEAEVMLCGGVDSVCRKTYSGFFRIGAITPDVCRPFDADRRGILTGEGAAVLVLESLDHARQRGAVIHAEVLGYGTNCDASHMTAPDRDSIAQCIRLAHERSGIAAEQVDYICAHGTGTRTNDVVEVGAIRDVFGAEAPPTSSIKSMLGHSMGAASAMGAIACVIGLEDGFMPPTVNFRSPDPQCEIDCVPNVARTAQLDVVENHGFAFGGNNAILILGHPRRTAEEVVA